MLNIINIDNIIAIITLVGFIMVSIGKEELEKWGFVIMAFAQAGWVWIGIHTNVPQLIWINIIFSLFSIFGAYKRFNK